MSAWNSNGKTVRSVTTATDVVTLTDDVVIYSSASAKTASLPGANTSTTQLGKQYQFSNIAANTVTLTPVSGLIDGAATKVIAAGGTAISCLTIISDGTGWRTIAYTTGS